MSYADALDLQNECVAERRRGAAPDRLLLLEHPPVITLGRSAKAENVLASREELTASGVEVFEIARGGDVTYHAPGQLVGYLILDLQARGEPEVHAFLRGIEASLGEALRPLGVPTRTLRGMTGVYGDDPAVGDDAPPRKIASIGVGVRHWVTFHGFALNVDIDLKGFERIVPCGLHQVKMTSVALELGSGSPASLPQQARAAVRDAFTRRWG